ncbi:MAG: ribulose-phosphate 3-epimerase [Holosporales bacterium]|jgi:ribulose-phosphate 3-epimerase|nr:ribulose-phosphate 3-epimerase [Holosporales bacterium]
MSVPLVFASLLNADFSCLEKEIYYLEKAGVDGFHIDIMDGHFVSQLSMGPEIVRTVRRLTERPITAHLMISPVRQHLQTFAQAGANAIIIHAETETQLGENLSLVRHLGCRVGLALNPCTAPEKAMPYIHDIDEILVMSVNPGIGGQSFQGAQLKKIRALHQERIKQEREISLTVDGGITPETLKQCIEMGADTCVVGQFLMRYVSEDRPQAISALKTAGKSHDTC